ncbi:hypothetical protein [Nocardioides litoris]|uniref:hypothetical protein n=1 Tax=Nocardioides litoris TaxID=1926648 RepID=UPI00112464C9|nr:hypothetical protein [Nocardioides litoris]
MFDTRATALATTIEDDWEPEIRQQWEATHRQIRESTVHRHGAEDYERKIDDLLAVGASPWTILDHHHLFLSQVRASFVQGTYYPALVGACALGERVLNELVLRIRDDYPDHPATAPVATQKTLINWGDCIHALVEWTVIDEPTATKLNDLKKLRHKSVHYGAHLRGDDGRGDALAAISLLQDVIGTLFTPFGGPPRFIAGTAGQSFIARDAEDSPLVRHFYLPNSTLVSPDYVVADHTLAIADNEHYQEQFPSLTDEEFAQHRRSAQARAGNTE